jgi:hypothetical protein
VLRRSPQSSLADARRRELLKAWIRVALSLAIANSPARTLGTLADIEPLMDASDDEIVARYFQARAIANIKARGVEQTGRRRRDKPRDLRSRWQVAAALGYGSGNG